MIKIKNVSVRFGQVSVLENITFDIKKGDYIGIIGPNGAGKSTLMKVILGLIMPTSGNIFIEKDISFGYVPQNYLIQNFFSLSVREVLEMGLSKKSIFRKSSDTQKCIEKLSMVGLSSSFLKKSFHDLSGGQKQRVIIARSLLHDPDLLLFDEPLSGVDQETKNQVYDLLADINKKYQTTIIFISHEIEMVVEKCKTIVCLDKTVHLGCHPTDFMKQGSKTCSVFGDNRDQSLGKKPIHHHHTNT